MGKRTGARIEIRGRGSVKDGKAKQKADPSDNDDLHVLVEADNQKSLDEAVTMVEDLLNPVSERMNEHKRAQLQELAELNAMVRDVKSPKVMGEQGHDPRSYTSGSKFAVACDTCGSRNHETIGCPLTASAPGSHADNQYRSFLADLG
uniref:Branchpoint-bridging protein n=1 Tax=Nelumbo nucifera TaxID=4432 RepID=A0A822ZRE1_NELNU|nr:TPA_asm: hypothetical protein HUJ06_017370 [Nelumbo nucifera]